MNVLVISRGYPSCRNRGLGVFELDQAKALAQLGNRVIVAAVDLRSFLRWRKWGRETVDLNGITVETINIPCGRIPLKVRANIGQIALEYLFRNVVAKHGKPDIIHSHFLGNGYITVNALKKFSVPIVHTEHSSALNQPSIHSRMREMATHVYRNVDKVIAVSIPLQARLKMLLGVESSYIPNVVDTSLFKYENCKKTKECFNVISVGNLTRNKGMDVLIKAFNGAFDRSRCVQLFIVGEGPEKKYLNSIIRSLSLEDKIFLTGSMERNEIVNIMRECHCFALTSRSETFGVAYVEALATGLPVIATRCGGPESFVNDENGILVDVDDIEEISGALQRMYDGIDTYVGQQIADQASENFGPAKVAKEILSVYEEVRCDRGESCSGVLGD